MAIAAIESTKTTWKRVSVRDVCESIIDCVNKTAPTVENATPYKMIRTTNVRNGWIDLSEVRYVTADIYERWTRRTTLQKGDVILTREAPLGEVGMLRRDDTVFLGQRLVLYRANPELLDNRFLLYAFQSHDLQAQIKSFGSGATVEHMRVPDCEELTVCMPPLATQRKIAAILSAYDDLIENNTRRIAILESMAQMLYREWFVHFRFPGHATYKMIDSPLGPIPEGWKTRELGALAHEIRRGVNPDEVNPEMPYVGLEHLPRKSIALNEWGRARDVQSTKLRFHKGDILFGKIRPYFHKVAVAPVDGVCSTDAIVIVPNDPQYFSLVLTCVSSDDFVKHATQTSQGTKMPRANWDILVKYPVAVPPTPILESFNGLVLDIVSQLRNISLRNANLRQTRDLLLPKLISGEVDVEDVTIETE